VSQAFLKRALVVIAHLAIVATASKSLLNEAFDDLKRYGETDSWSSEESRSRGVLLSELDAIPAEWPVPGGHVRFGEVWIEERALTTHRFIWLPAERRIGGYRLHFTLADGRGLIRDGDLRFTVDGALEKYAGQISSSDGELVYIIRLDSRDVTRLRLRLVGRDDQFLSPEIHFAHPPGSSRAEAGAAAADNSLAARPDFVYSHSCQV
jgi:hypothetical protein